jgi:hypothetical protein
MQNMKSMLKWLFFAAIFIGGLSFRSNASTYRLNYTEIDNSFRNAIEISVSNFAFKSAPYPQTLTNHFDQNIAGVLAICCGTFGVHRFYMGQTEAGLQHLAISALSAVVGGAGLFVLNSKNLNSSTTGSSTNNGGLLALGVLGYGLGYCASGAHGVYTLIEGVMYLVMPEEKFQGKIVKDPRFFAAFKRD